MPISIPESQRKTTTDYRLVDLSVAVNLLQIPGNTNNGVTVDPETRRVGIGYKTVDQNGEAMVPNNAADGRLMITDLVATITDYAGLSPAHAMHAGDLAKIVEYGFKYVMQMELFKAGKLDALPTIEAGIATATSNLANLV